MKVAGGSEGDMSVGIPSMSFEMNFDSEEQCPTLKECLDEKCSVEGFKTYREYLRHKIQKLVEEIHDNGRVTANFEDEYNY